MKRTSIHSLPTWQTQKALLKSKFKKLLDADLDFDETRKNEMFTKLALKLGMTTKEIIKIISQGS